MGIENHENYEAIRSFINTTLANITTEQARYYGRNQKYFQGLMIPSQRQLSGEGFEAIDYGLHPSDNSDSWNTFLAAHFNSETRIPVNISVQIYESPDLGHGWIFIAEFWNEGLGPDKYGNDGNHWMWQHNEGPEKRIGIWDDWHIEPGVPGM